MLEVQPDLPCWLDMFDVVRPSRSDSGQRRYSPGEIDHIDAINCPMGEGITLVGAPYVLEFQAEIERLRQQIAELEAH